MIYWDILGEILRMIEGGRAAILLKHLKREAMGFITIRTLWKKISTKTEQDWKQLKRGICAIEVLTRVIEGSLEVKLPTIWTDGKAEVGRVREEKKREDQRRERVRRKKIQVREKVGKSRNTVFLQWFVAPEGRKVGSLKRRARSNLARWEMKNCTPLRREAHFEVKMHKAPQLRSTFGSWDDEKVHAVVARSTFRSQNAQNTPFSYHSWKLRCWKKCMPLWREAHFEVKTYNAHRVRTTFGSWDVEKVYAVVARSTFWSQNVQSTPRSEHLWKFRCWEGARCFGAKHISKSKL